MKTYRFESESSSQDDKLNKACAFLDLLTDGKSKELKKYIEKNAVRLEDIDEKMYFEV